MKRILLNVVLFLALSNAARAQWSNDPMVGTPVATATTEAKTSLVSASDGAGGMFVAWIDSRVDVSQSIFIQRILPGGTTKFTSEIEVTSSPNVGGGTSVTKSNLTISADGAGGVVLAWQDARNTTTTSSNTDIYGQRVDADGNLLWTAGGVRLTNADNTVSSKTNPTIDVVSATEAIVVFRDNRLGTVDMFAQKISLGSGAPVWGADVALHGNQVGTQTSQSVLRDGGGGLFVVWEDPRTATTDRQIYGQRITNDGVVLWGNDGIVISEAANNQLSPQLVSDNAGGIVVTWWDLRTSTTNSEIYAQRLNADGAAQWTADGIQITSAANNQTNPMIVNNGANFVIGWGDNRQAATGNRDIYAQAIDATGNLLWTPAGGAALDGIPIVTATGNQLTNVNSGMQMVSDGAGNVIFIWEDARISNAELDLYAQKIDASGAVQWATDGVPVSTATASQQGPVATLSLNGSVIAAWRDGRTATNGEIYAALLQTTGVLPVRSIDVNALTKAASINVKWTTLGEENVASFIVEKSSNGRSFAAIGSVKAKGEGNGSYSLEDTKPAKGANFYRIKSVDQNGSISYSGVVMVQFGATVKAALSIYPNPVAGTATLQLVNLPTGLYQLRVMDLSGRAVMMKTVAVNNEYMVLPLSLQTLAAGNYAVQLEDGKGNKLAQFIQKN